MTGHDHTGQEEMTLGRKLGRIVSSALAKELDEHRWFINWRTLDDKDQWTVADFHGLDWQTQLGTVGSLGIDIVANIKQEIAQLIEAETLQARIEGFMNGQGYILVDGHYERTEGDTATVANMRQARWKYEQHIDELKQGEQDES